MQYTHSKLKGFTLIELSIVLLIIGLILSGVTVGAELVRQSKVRSVITETNNIASAVNAFKIQYNALPGDISNATTYFGATDANGYTVTNGGGDSYIGSTNINNQENWSAFQELSLAGYIDGVFTGAVTTITASYPLGVRPNINVPPLKYGNGIVYWFYSGDMWGNYTTSNSIVISGPGGSYGYDDYRIPVADAKTIDDKIDDGLPYSGHVISYNDSAVNKCVASRISTVPSHALPYLVTSNTYCTTSITIVQF
jgi:prepilin-type N-terminal cleavage/methylation domain-containing protein